MLKAFENRTVIVLILIALVLAVTERIVVRAQSTQPTVASAESTRPGVPPANVAPSDTFGWSLAFGVIMNYLMRKMKNSLWFPTIKNGAGTILFILSGATALVSALGIHTEFDAAAGTFTATGLHLSGILHSGGDWVRQWAAQQYIYQTTTREYV